MLHMPLCLTWLDYDTNSSDTGLLVAKRSGREHRAFLLVNYVAVGSMEGMIELFDVDLVDQMEPLHTFGKKPKKKKSKKPSKVRRKD